MKLPSGVPSDPLHRCLSYYQNDQCVTEGIGDDRQSSDRNVFGARRERGHHGFEKPAPRCQRTRPSNLTRSPLHRSRAHFRGRIPSGQTRLTQFVITPQQRVPQTSRQNAKPSSSVGDNLDTHDGRHGSALGTPDKFNKAGEHVRRLRPRNYISETSCSQSNARAWGRFRMVSLRRTKGRECFQTGFPTSSPSGPTFRVPRRHMPTLPPTIQRPSYRTLRYVARPAEIATPPNPP